MLFLPSRYSILHNLKGVEDKLQALSHHNIPEHIKHEISSVVEVLREKFAGNIHKIILFGSYAKHDYQPDSDVDIAVALHTLPPLKERRAYAADFDFEQDIDLLFCSKEQLDSNVMIYKWINEQGVVLYEQL